MAIEPMGAMDKVPSLVEKRAWIPAVSENEEAIEDPVQDVMEAAVSKAQAEATASVDL